MTIEELKELIRIGAVSSISELEDVEYDLETKYCIPCVVLDLETEAYRDRLIQVAKYYNSKREERRNEAIIDWFSENYKGEVDIPYIVENIDDHIDSMDDIVDKARGMDVGEIIYYSSAIKYLAENDASLHESLALADELGYACKDLSSEILASLLNNQNIISDLEELSSNFEDFLEEYDENHPEL